MRKIPNADLSGRNGRSLSQRYIEGLGQLSLGHPHALESFKSTLPAPESVHVNFKPSYLAATYKYSCLNAN